MRERKQVRVSMVPWRRAVLVAVSVAGLGVRLASAQEAPATAGAPVGDEAIEKFTEDELLELVGPIALYPDVLIAQILPASSYPLELVQAERDLEAAGGKLSEEEINKLDYDVSVLALMHYPEVIEMLNEDLDWTMTLGDAVVVQQEEVMMAIQRFRQEVDTAGNLQSNDEMVVEKEQDIIRIEPANPQVIYVPSYSPQTVVVKEERVSAAPLITFTTGLIVGGWLSYGCSWGYGRCHIDVRHHHYWGRIRPGWGATPYWRPNAGRRAAYRHGRRHGAAAGWVAGQASSRHVARRTARRTGRRSGAASGAVAGGVTGRRTGAASGARAGARPGTADRRPGAGVGARPGTADRRPGAGVGARSGTADRRPSAGAGARPAVQPYGNPRSGSTARQYSQRGATSRSGTRPTATPQPRPSSSRSAFGGYRSGNTARMQSSRGAASRGRSAGGGRASGMRSGAGRGRR